MVCPRCGAAHATPAAYCPRCGLSLGHRSAKTPDTAALAPAPPASELAVHRLRAYFEDADPGRPALELGARSPAVRHIRRALRALQSASFDPHLTGQPPDDELFDADLQSAVRAFQAWQGHSSVDGVVGPGTRDRLARVAWERCGPRFLLVLQGLRKDVRPRAFLSHASADTPAVEAIEAYLAARDVAVVRYTHSFIPGHEIAEEIEGAVARADKVVVFRSAHAARSSWVLREIQLALELERALHLHLLIHVLLEAGIVDPADESRILIQAAGRPLDAVGDDLLRALHGPRH
jgi:peptidoglycan hydrolase-like protein with peptidoglycan-binding domain